MSLNQLPISRPTTTRASHHYLYALGTVGTTRLKRFWITNPDDTIRKRFETLLGPLAKERVIVDPTGFGEDMNRLRHEFARK